MTGQTVEQLYLLYLLLLLLLLLLGIATTPGKATLAIKQKHGLEDGNSGWVSITAPEQQNESEVFSRSERGHSSISSSSSMSSSSSSMSSSSSNIQQMPVYPAKNNSITNITGQLGGSAFLPCHTHHSMETQVSWMRRRDFHILTSGRLTYTKEGRFQIHHKEGSTQWTLAIKYLQLNDSAIYECHISTGGGVVAQLVWLHIVQPKAYIPGTGEHHVQAGSTISITCYIQQSPEPPQYIFWYHDGRMINYDKQRGGVNVEVEKDGKVETHLSISNATPDDSGNYTCDAANTKPAYITVYVTQANQIAAVQPRAMDGGGCVKATWPLTLILAFINVVH